MDPNAAYAALDAALRANDRDTALSALESLTQWLKRGGFLPRPLGYAETKNDAKREFQELRARALRLFGENRE